MRKLFLSISILACLFIISCQTATEVKKDEPAGHSNQALPPRESNILRAELKTNPAQAEAGKPTELVFTIRNSTGEMIRDLQIVHEKPMHLIIVSEDLAEFYHEHPEPQADGTFKTSFTFKNGGNFKLYADFTPKDAKQTVKSFSLPVSGTERSEEALKADPKLEKTVGDLFVTLKTDGAVSAEKELRFNFQVFDAKTKKPVTDLQKYLGESAHFVVISQDLRDFVHVHPVSRENVKSELPHDGKSVEKQDAKLAGIEAEAIVSASLVFPAPGLYKIFAQFQRSDQVTTVPFVVNVKEPIEAADNFKSVEVPKDAYRITVSKEGFIPNEITLPKGNFNKLAFVRLDAENCADEVVFKSLNLRKKLPVGKVILIDLPKDFTGELLFACGMNMYQGKLVVQ